MNTPHTHFDYSRIVVHGMNFHTDDILCVVLAKMMNPNIEVVRTNDMDKVNQYLDDSNTIVADIGRGYFDHHQQDSVMSNIDGHKLCSAGIIYQTYKNDILMHPTIRKHFENVLAEIDLQDNTGAVQALATMNEDFLPPWNQPNTEENYTSRFMDAVNALMDILKTKEPERQIILSQKQIGTSAYQNICDNLRYVRNIKATMDLFTYAYQLNPMSIVSYEYYYSKYAKEAIEAAEAARKEMMNLCRNDTSENLRVLVMDHYVPQSYLRETNYLFAVYPSNRGGWNLQTVQGAVDGSSRVRISPNTEKDPNCTFLHHSGFLACFTDKESAIIAAKNEIYRDKLKESAQELDFLFRRYFGGQNPSDPVDTYRLCDAISLASLEYANKYLKLANDPLFKDMYTNITGDKLFSDIINNWSFAALNSRINGYGLTYVANVLCELGLVGEFQKYSDIQEVIVGEPLPKELQLNTEYGYLSISDFGEDSSECITNENPDASDSFEETR